MFRRILSTGSAVAVGVVLATAAPMAFEFTEAQTPRISRTDLAIIGDSLISRTMGAYDYGQIRASGNRGANIPGSDGQTGQEVVAAMIPTIVAGGWLVVELGINDIAQGVPAEAFGAWVVSVTEQLPDDRCLAWVLPWGRNWQVGAVQYAAAITGAIGAQPCHAVIGWVPTEAGYRVSDGTHLTPAGGDVLASMIYAAVGR